MFRKLSNKNGDVINKFLDMVKSECDSKNEKVKIFSKELNHYLDILSKFTDWIKDKNKKRIENENKLKKEKRKEEKEKTKKQE